MPNSVFDELLSEQADIFVNAFTKVSQKLFFDENSKRLIHAGEFGVYRESICAQFLRFVVPQRLEFATGFLINALDGISSQLDVVIFDSASTPLIQGSSRQRFFPVETVVSVGEAKSAVDKTELRKALNKLSKVKAMRENIPSPAISYASPSRGYNASIKHGYDQLFTFLICDSFEFDCKKFIPEFQSIYDSDIKPDHRANLILSLKNGLISYRDEHRGSLMYPCLGDQVLKHRLLAPDEDNPDIPTKVFASFLFQATSSATIFFPDPITYVNNLRGGVVNDES